MKPRLRHVVWDWNGTLLDDAGACVRSLNALLRETGRPPIDLAAFRAHVDFPIRRLYERLGFADLERTFPDLTARFMARYLGEEALCPLQPEAAETLAWVASTGRSQSILSAADQRSLEAGLGQRALAAHFLWIVGQDDMLGGSKVARGRRWLAEVGLDPAEVLLVGDTVHDAEVADALGIHCWLVSHGYHDRSRLAPTGHPVLDSLAEVRARLAAGA